MSKELFGSIKDPKFEYEFEAIRYYAPTDKYPPTTTANWLNLTTGRRTLNNKPGGGYILWNIFDDLKYDANHGYSMRYTLMHYGEAWKRATESSFFRSSNYPKIVKPFKNLPFDNILALTPEQTKLFDRRLDILLPGLKQHDLEYVEMDAIMDDHTGMSCCFEAVALVKDLPSSHVCPVWFNLDTGRNNIGRAPYTIILKTNSNFNIKERIEERGLPYALRIVYDVWKNTVMTKYLDDLRSTILAQAYSMIGEPAAVNLHFIVTAEQMPDDWNKPKSKTDDSNEDLSGLAELAMLF